MDLTSTVSWAWIAGIVGLAFGFYQWKRASDEKVDREGQFKGIVNTKLDTIISDAKENSREHSELKEILNDHGTRITVLEEAKRTRRKVEEQ